MSKLHAKLEIEFPKTSRKRFYSWYQIKFSDLESSLPLAFANFKQQQQQRQFFFEKNSNLTECKCLRSEMNFPLSSRLIHSSIPALNSDVSEWQHFPILVIVIFALLDSTEYRTESTSSRHKKKVRWKCTQGRPHRLDSKANEEWEVLSYHHHHHFLWERERGWEELN